MEVLFVIVIYRNMLICGRDSDRLTHGAAAVVSKKVFHINSCYATPFATKKGIPVV